MDKDKKIEADLSINSHSFHCFAYQDVDQSQML